MLKLTIQRQESKTTIVLEGKLSGQWVAELERAWREELKGTTASSITVLLRCILYVNSEGKTLLKEMARTGTHLEGSGCMTRALVDSVARSATAQNKDPNSAELPRKILGIVFLTAVLLSGKVALAQEKPSQKLTLRDAVRLALQQNPQVQIAALSYAQSQKDREIALSDLLPQVHLGVSDEVTRGNIETAFGKRIPGFSQVIGPFQIFTAGTQFSAPVLDLTLWRRWQAAKETVSAGDAQRQSVREQMVLLVVSQYLGALRAGADVRAAQSRMDLAQALYEQARDMQTHGVGTGIDTLRANVELQNEKQRLLVAETDQKVAFYGLSRLLDLDSQQPLELTDQLSFFDTPANEADGSLDRAYTLRPELRVLEAQDRASQKLKSATSLSRLPSLSFQGAWSYQGLSISSGIPVYQYQAAFTVPLFTGGRVHAEIAREDLELKKIAQQREDLRDQIALEVKTAVAQLESARHQVDVANLGVQLAQEEVTQARDRFQAGVANNIEVVSAQDALARANDNQIAALYRYNQARADLARSTGRMESLYAK
jgi:outer membrane protein TolC